MSDELEKESPRITVHVPDIIDPADATSVKDVNRIL